MNKMSISERTAQRYLRDSNYYFKQCHYSKALDYINQSLTYAKWSDSYSLRANIYLKIGKLDDAMKDFRTSIKMTEIHLEKGNGNEESVRDYIQSVTSLAGILYDRKNYKQAKEFIEKAQLAILSYDYTESQTRVQTLDFEISSALMKEEEKSKPKPARPKSSDRTSSNRHHAAIKNRPRQISVHGSTIARSAIQEGVAQVKAKQEDSPSPRKIEQRKQQPKELKKSVSRITEFVFDPLLSADNSPDTYRVTDIYFGRTGLQNLGNTCYMNSTIQALAAIPEIKNYFLNNIETNHLMEENDYDLLSQQEILRISERMVLRKHSTITQEEIDSELDRSLNQSGHSSVKEIKKIEDAVSPMAEMTKNDEKREILNDQKEQGKEEKKEEEKKNPPPLAQLIKHKNGIFTSCFAEIIRQLWISKSVSLSPDTLYYMLAEIVPHFQNYTQQDAAECLTYMLEILHNELNVSIAAKLQGSLAAQLEKYSSPKTNEDIWQQYWLNNQSIVTYLFTGMAQYSIKCKKCSFSQNQPQFFNMLQLELPGNQEYKVRFVPLSEKLKPSVHPYSFQIQLREKEFLDRKTILEKSSRLLHEEKNLEIDENNVQIYEEIAIKNYETLKPFEENKGLNDETNTIVIFEHPRFDPLYKDQVQQIPVVFELDSYYNNYREWLIFPIEKTKSYKDIVTILRTYESRRLKKKSQVRNLGRSSFYGSSLSLSSLIDIKVYDNLPPDPTYSKWSIKCGFCNQQHYMFKHCEPRCSGEMTLAEMFQLAGKRELKFVAQFKTYISSEELRDFKNTSSLVNTEIESKQVLLKDCILNSMQPELLESFVCEKCKSNDTTFKEMSLERLPPVLIIHLKRFLVKQKANVNFFKTLKNNVMVNFPIKQLNLEEFLPHSSSKDQNSKYYLQSVVYHLGGSGSGHYITKRVQMGDYGKTKWVQVNDSKVQNVAYYTEELDRKIITPEAYILFYRRIVKQSEIDFYQQDNRKKRQFSEHLLK